MRNVKLLNGLLWGFNIVLGAGIVVFAFNYLLFPKNANLLADIVQSNDLPLRPTPQTGSDLNFFGGRLRLPLTRPAEDGGPEKLPTGFPPQAKLTGTVPSKDKPKEAYAFVNLGNRNLVVQIDKEIEDGNPVAEFRGWRLVEVYSDRAVFTNGTVKVPLKIEESTASAIMPNVDPKRKVEGDGGFQSGRFRSTLVQSTDSYQRWEIDPNEIQDLIEHFEQRLQTDLELGTNPQGGIVIRQVRNGSQAAMRGLEADDVIKSVNGIELSNLDQVQQLGNNPRITKQQTLSLTVMRAGKPITFVYGPGKQ